MLLVAVSVCGAEAPLSGGAEGAAAAAAADCGATDVECADAELSLSACTGTCELLLPFCLLPITLIWA